MAGREFMPDGNQSPDINRGGTNPPEGSRPARPDPRQVYRPTEGGGTGQPISTDSPFAVLRRTINRVSEGGPPPPRGPGTPESPRPPDGGGENIWGPEFRAEGRKIAREIFGLEKLRNDAGYDKENDPKLDQLYVDWKKWVANARRTSIESEPFYEKSAPEYKDLDGEYTEKELAEAVVDAELTYKQPDDEQPIDLSKLPPLKDKIDEAGNIIEGLLSKYNRLLDERASPDQMFVVEEQLGKYFLEAKRLNLLHSVDASLGPLYLRIKTDLAKKVAHSDIRAYISESETKISDMGKDLLRFKKRLDQRLTPELVAQLNGVWDVYTEIAIDRFRYLLYENGGMQKQTINGEFSFSIAEATFSTETGEEGLRQSLPTDVQLRELAERDLATDAILRQNAGKSVELFYRLLRNRNQTEEVLRRFAGGSDEEYRRLLNNREEVYNRLLEEREATYRSNIEQNKEARKNLAGDRESLRRIAIERELYWAPTYANYYEVFAEDEEQFQKAVDTFTQWIRSGQTKSPNELFQRVSGFKDALTTAGYREKAIVNPDFMILLRHQLEGIIGIMGANHANEHYNPAFYKQFLDFMAQDEGPDRFIALGRVYRGRVSALLHKFDNDPAQEIFFSTFGARGELFAERNPVEMHRLRAQSRNGLIEEMLGVDIKDYDPRDPHKRTDKIYLERNLNELSRFQSDEEFKGLFEGFDLETQKRFYNDERFQAKLKRWERAKEIDVQIKAGANIKNLGLDPKERADYIRYKKGRLKLTAYEDRMVKAVIIRKYLDEGRSPGELKGVDPALYEMYTETANVVDLAIEMYGAMGEKAKRMGGVYLVERKNIDGSPMKDSFGNPVVEYHPAHLAEKIDHFAENWTKATYGGELDEKVQARLSQEKRRAIKGIPADEMYYRVGQARRMASWALKTHGRDAKLWDFTLLRDNKPVDINTLGYTEFGVDDSKDNDIDKYRYAVPVNTRILGYNNAGGEVILAFDDTGKPIGLEWDGNGQAVIFDKPPTVTVEKDGKEVEVVADRTRILFDNLNKNTKAQRMQLKVPRLKLNDDNSVFRPLQETKDNEGNIIKRSYEKPVLERTDLVDVDFHVATHHIYSRWTGYPYWGYQEEDTGLLLSDQSFEAAKRIKAGLSRPEDEEPHATQLLIVDPTLQRVVHFRHKESREDMITLAAVEESYISHWRIRDELNQLFLPDGANVESSRTAYVLQDDGGSTKQWFNATFEAARWSDAKTRRAKKLVALFPLHFAPMSDMWGAGGALNILRMFGYKEYRMVGLFALQKWIAQTGGAQDLYEALFGWYSEQEKRSREGYGEKINNDADSLQKNYGKLSILKVKLEKLLSSDKSIKVPEVLTSEDTDIEYINSVREAMGRPEVSTQRIRVLETDMRGERTPKNLEGIDIYERNPDGSIKEVHGQRVYNQKIDSNSDSGSSRHSASWWFWRMAWFQSTEGKKLYPTEIPYFNLMTLPTLASLRVAKILGTIMEYDKTKLVSRWRWLYSKIVR